MRSCLSILFFFNAPAPSEIYTLSLHDALPILLRLGVAGNRGGEKSKRSFCKKLPARIWHEPSGDKAEALYANNLGAEEDRLALEHFDGDEERRGRIDAAREQNKQDVVPVKSAGDYFFADQASAEDGNESELGGEVETGQKRGDRRDEDRKSTRLNSSHLGISYAVFCLKKK